MRRRTPIRRQVHRAWSLDTDDCPTPLVALVALLASGTTAIAPVASAAVLVYRTATSGPALVGGSVFVVVTVSLDWLRDSETSLLTRVRRGA